MGRPWNGRYVTVRCGVLISLKQLQQLSIMITDWTQPAHETIRSGDQSLFPSTEQGKRHVKPSFELKLVNPDKSTDWSLTTFGNNADMSLYSRIVQLGHVLQN